MPAREAGPECRKSPEGLIDAGDGVIIDNSQAK